MSILNEDYQSKELEQYFDGSMQQGLGIECDLDNHLRFKKGQFNLILGNDNVGKTFWLLWYFTILSVKQNLTWTIYCSENEVWSVKQKLMGFYLNKSIKLKYIKEKDFYSAKNWVENYFKFVDTNKLYTVKQLLEVFEESDTDGYLLDPYNSLTKEKGSNSHEYDYEMASLVRMFCRRTKKTIYISMHPVSDASRNKHTDGAFKGQQAPPLKSHAEGGQKWANRCDDFLILHRYFTEDMKLKTLLFVEKIKETETGGERTPFANPLVFMFRPYGFSVNGKNPLQDTFVNENTQTFNYNGGFENVEPEEVEIREDKPF